MRQRVSPSFTTNNIPPGRHRLAFEFFLILLPPFGMWLATLTLRPARGAPPVDPRPLLVAAFSGVQTA